MSSILPLYGDPVYTYTTKIGANSYKLKFTLSTRQRIYHIDIFDSAGNAYAEGISLVDGIVTRIEDGFLCLVKIDRKEFSDTAPTELYKYFTLLYISLD